MMSSDQIKGIHKKLLHSNPDSLLTENILKDPMHIPGNHQRPHSIVVEDAFFGDSGKGSVTAKFLHAFKDARTAFSIRYNGGANAGHETYKNGKKIVTHQLPSGIILENVTGIITRGTVLHPQDLLFEIERVKGICGSLPGKLLIDERTPLVLDTHRAREETVNQFITGGKGSTGKGIASAYESVYGRYMVTVKDLYDENWKKIFTEHYNLYAKFLKGFDVNLSQIKVNRLGKKEKQLVGSADEFLDNLENLKEELKPYVTSEAYYIIKKAWEEIHLPFVIEGAQGIGIDPYHGVYPDITASRPGSRNLNDATYNIIVPEEVALRVGVMKTTYMSSVGIRKLPTEENSQYESWIQSAFDEKGRTTGRLRDIYPVSIPIAQYLRKAAGYNYIVATHMDASTDSKPISIITHYTDKETGAEVPYLPYQDALDNMKPHFLSFKGWDGEAIKSIHSVEKLPYDARLYLAFLSNTIAPVYMATTGADLDEFVSWSYKKKARIDSTLNVETAITT